MSERADMVAVEIREQVAVLEMRRPERLNALSLELVERMIERLGELERNPEVKSLVLTGAGRAFSAGGDLEDVADRAGQGTDAILALVEGQQELIVRLRESRLPVVAVVTGPAFGAGWSLVLACDLVVASEGASFCQVFVRRNLVPDLGSAWLLPRTVGRLAAMEMMLLGEEIDASRALALGLVNRLQPDRESASAEGMSLAKAIARASSTTNSLLKSLVHGSEQLGFDDSLRLERQSQCLLLEGEECRTQIRAFLDKRQKKRDQGLAAGETNERVR
jgi:2-(1,2-epoxy-1,2-dihydrophenyl)acetyl-CoA isomerase